MTNAFFTTNYFLAATGLMIVGYGVLLIIVFHNLFIYIIREQRYRGPSVQLAVFYGLAIPFLLIQLFSCSVILIEKKPVLGITEAINLVSALLLLLIGANNILMMN